MSMNKALNAAVALIEGRTDIAKEIIRAPGSDVKNVPEILSRIERAVNRAAAQAMRNALMETLKVQWNAGDFNGCSLEEAYYGGIFDVEAVILAAVERLEQA